MRPFRYLVRPLLFSRRRAPVRALSASPLTSLLGPLGSFFDVLTSVAARAQQRAPLHDSETRGGDAGAQRTAILEAALAHVSAQGWTMDALAAGADTLGCVHSFVFRTQAPHVWISPSRARCRLSDPRPDPISASQQRQRDYSPMGPSSSCGT